MAKETTFLKFQVFRKKKKKIRLATSRDVNGGFEIINSGLIFILIFVVVKKNYCECVKKGATGGNKKTGFVRQN